MIKAIRCYVLELQSSCPEKFTRTEVAAPWTEADYMWDNLKYNVADPQTQELRICGMKDTCGLINQKCGLLCPKSGLLDLKCSLIGPKCGPLDPKCCLLGPQCIWTES